SKKEEDLINCIISYYFRKDMENNIKKILPKEIIILITKYILIKNIFKFDKQIPKHGHKDCLWEIIPIIPSIRDIEKENIISKFNEVTLKLEAIKSPNIPHIMLYDKNRLKDFTQFPHENSKIFDINNYSLRYIYDKECN